MVPASRLDEPKEGAPSSPSVLLSWHSTIGSWEWNDDCSGSPVPCWAQCDVPSPCWLWGTLHCQGRSWHWYSLEELWRMQPCFAGWAMVECDIAGQDAPKPRIATLHPIKKKALAAAQSSPWVLSCGWGWHKYLSKVPRRNPHPSIRAAMSAGFCAHGPALPCSFSFSLEPLNFVLHV